MTSTARLLWVLSFARNLENILQVMHFDKDWYKNDRLHIEIMIL